MKFLRKHVSRTSWNDLPLSRESGILAVKWADCKRVSFSSFSGDSVPDCGLGPEDFLRS